MTMGSRRSSIAAAALFAVALAACASRFETPESGPAATAASIEDAGTIQPTARKNDSMPVFGSVEPHRLGDRPATIVGHVLLDRRSPVPADVHLFAGDDDTDRIRWIAADGRSIAPTGCTGGMPDLSLVFDSYDPNDHRIGTIGRPATATADRANWTISVRSAAQYLARLAACDCRMKDAAGNEVAFRPDFVEVTVAIDDRASRPTPGRADRLMRIRVALP